MGNEYLKFKKNLQETLSKKGSIEKISNSSLTILTGKCGTGKTFAALDFINKNKGIKSIYSNAIDTKVLPIDLKFLKNEVLYRENDEAIKDPILFVIDEAHLSLENLVDNEYFKEIVTKGEKLGIFTILISQSLEMIEEILKSNGLEYSHFTMNEEKVEKGFCQHYKGGIYEVLGVSKHTERLEDLVVYKDAEGALWARPLFMFKESLEYEGTLVKRFKRLEDFKNIKK